MLLQDIINGYIPTKEELVILVGAFYSFVLTTGIFGMLWISARSQRDKLRKNLLQKSKEGNRK